MTIRFFLPVLLGLVLAAPMASAHHSFAIYDVDNKIHRTGELVSLEFSQPHIRAQLLVRGFNGAQELWVIESLSPRRWDRLGKPRDFAQPGDLVTLEGWPARNGQDEMLLSSITVGSSTLVIIDKVRQPGARSKNPPATVKRD